MELFRERVFQFLLNSVVGRDSFGELRKKALKDLDGAVLEIGFGTSLNLPYYPQAVRKITAIDPERFQKRYMKTNSATSPSVEFIQAPGEALPLDSQSVDQVVTTWTLCSVKDPSQVLSEIERVLKPGGTHVFVEHGRAPQGIDCLFDGLSNAGINSI